MTRDRFAIRFSMPPTQIIHHRAQVTVKLQGVLFSNSTNLSKN